MNKLQRLFQGSTKRFYQSRLEDMQAELDHIDEQMAELKARRDVLVVSIDFCEGRVGA